MNLKVLEEKARKDNPDYPRGCAVVFDIVAMGLSEHGGYHEELAREELPPGARVLTREQVSYLAHLCVGLGEILAVPTSARAYDELKTNIETHVESLIDELFGKEESK